MLLLEETRAFQAPAQVKKGMDPSDRGQFIKILAYQLTSEQTRLSSFTV